MLYPSYQLCLSLMCFLCTPEPVTVAIAFVGNGTETFSIQLSVPSHNHSVLPERVHLNCTDATSSAVLSTAITQTDSTFKLDMNSTVSCCVSAPNTRTKCVTYTPNMNDQGITLVLNKNFRRLYRRLK